MSSDEHEISGERDIIVTCLAIPDETGRREEFSWDLLPKITPQATLHLDTNGLPKIGTHIVPGMIVMGKIGRTKDYDPKCEPTCLDLHSLDPVQLRARFGHMWTDRSVYATEQTQGVVVEATLCTLPTGEQAFVVLRKA